MSDVEVLVERAARYRELILEVACGPGGMIIAFPRFDNRRPFQEGEEHHLSPLGWYEEDTSGDNWLGSRPTVAEWLYGENTLWATGWFLWSQILRYRATKEAEALETARKCFRDLNNIFRLCREIEPGLLGKPHGGRAGPTTSFDQAACPVIFYAAYAQELATPEEKAEAVENMRLHGDYYLRRNWVMNHHGNLQRVVDPAGTSTMKYLACVYAAYELTGETRFRDAAFKYMRQIISSGRLPWPSKQYEINHNLYYYALLCDYWSKTDIKDEADWKGCIKEYWQAAKTALDEEGVVRSGHYDTINRSFAAYPDRWVTNEDARTWPFHAPRKAKKWWMSSTCFPNRACTSACVASLALLAYSYGLDDHAHRSAKQILLRLDENTLRLLWDDGKLPNELKPALNIFATEHASMWLVAYWMGRLQQVW